MAVRLRNVVRCVDGFLKFVELAAGTKMTIPWRARVNTPDTRSPDRCVAHGRFPAVMRAREPEI
jgi:hypothetical protein